MRIPRRSFIGALAAMLMVGPQVAGAGETLVVDFASVKQDEFGFLHNRIISWKGMSNNDVTVYHLIQRAFVRPDDSLRIVSFAYHKGALLGDHTQFLKRDISGKPVTREEIAPAGSWTIFCHTPEGKEVTHEIRGINDVRTEKTCSCT